MPNAVTFASWKLKEGVSVQKFLLAAEKMHNEYASRVKGHISQKLLVDGDVWAELIVWETMEDAQNAGNDESNIYLREYFSYIDVESITYHRHFSIEKSC